MNEKGFSFVEGLLSLSILFIICITLVPFVFTIITQLLDAKKEMIGHRLLYEYVQEFSELREPHEVKRLSQGIEYTLYFEERTGVRRACFYYEEQPTRVQ